MSEQHIHPEEVQALVQEATTQTLRSPAFLQAIARVVGAFQQPVQIPPLSEATFADALVAPQILENGLAILLSLKPLINDSLVIMVRTISESAGVKNNKDDLYPDTPTPEESQQSDTTGYDVVAYKPSPRGPVFNEVLTLLPAVEAEIKRQLHVVKISGNFFMYLAALDTRDVKKES